MRQIEEADVRPDEEISLRDILEWVRRWWRFILGGCIVGVLAGLIVHLTVAERFTVHLDITMLDSPLASTPVVRNIATNLLRRHVDATADIEFSPRTGVLSLTEEDVPGGEVAGKQASLERAVAALRVSLDERVRHEYTTLRERSETMPPDPDIFARVNNLRFFVAALDEGLIRSVAVEPDDAAKNRRAQRMREQRVQSQRPSLPVLLLLGAVGGGCLGAATAFVAESSRRRRSRRRA